MTDGVQTSKVSISEEEFCVIREGGPMNPTFTH